MPDQKNTFFNFFQSLFGLLSKKWKGWLMPIIAVFVVVFIFLTIIWYEKSTISFDKIDLGKIIAVVSIVLLFIFTIKSLFSNRKIIKFIGVLLMLILVIPPLLDYFNYWELRNQWERLFPQKTEEPSIEKESAPVKNEKIGSIPTQPNNPKRIPPTEEGVSEKVQVNLFLPRNFLRHINRTKVFVDEIPVDIIDQSSLYVTISVEKGTHDIKILNKNLSEEISRNINPNNNIIYFN